MFLSLDKMVGKAGAGPAFVGSKPTVLPLNDSPVKKAVKRHRPSRTVVLRVLTVASYSYNFFLVGKN